MCDINGDGSNDLDGQSNEDHDKNGGWADSWVNGITDYLTYGTSGYKGGKFYFTGDKSGGPLMNNAKEFVGGLNGTNQARKQAMLGQDAINEEKAAKTQQFKDELARKQKQDVSASQMAGALQKQAADQNNQQYLGGSGNPHSDFLGL